MLGEEDIHIDNYWQFHHSHCIFLMAKLHLKEPHHENGNEQVEKSIFLIYLKNCDGRKNFMAYKMNAI